MADKALGLFDGEAGAEAIVINAIANEALKIGSIVSLLAAATGEIMPRVAHPALSTSTAIGVVTGGDNNGIYVDGLLANDGDAAAAAGEVVRVCIFGRCKIRVDGNAGAIVVGNGLAFDADGVADLAVVTDYTVPLAGQGSTVATDAILCFVNPTGIQT